MDSFEPINGPPSLQLRKAYLDGLAEPQELFLERMVDRGSTLVGPEGVYAVVADRRLVEFFVPEALHDKTVHYFDTLRKTGRFDLVFCKSFDSQLLFAALSSPAKVTTGGLLFRRVADPEFIPLPGVQFRAGNVSDTENILAIDADGFFDSVEEIAQLAAEDGLVLLETSEAVPKLLGCGISQAVVAGREDIDIGMMVAPHQRRKGYATSIISYLKNRCLERKQRPICGCSVDNPGSARALVNAGFAVEHRMLVIEY